MFATIINLDINFIVGSLLISSIVAVCALLIKNINSVNHLVQVIGSVMPPEGIQGRLHVHENELRELRDWCIRNGFDRRESNEARI